ncbi:MAG: response regulator [Coleofasciculus sp. C1-SOL-03]|jgi:DNA-binding response OmpR family regulator|uniref:response regulator n=1 Tax=Coleofasciculus sp. C1-SOL-03 TaxID=3069522 RepID=UPI003302EFDA
MKILIVDDDPVTASPLLEALTAHHYLVEAATNAEYGLELAQTSHYDLAVLDLTPHHLDGIHLCQKLRHQGSQMPILLLSAKGSSADRIRGLEAGADDYVIKPYDLSELMARIRALLRRRHSTVSKVLTWEKLRLEPDTGEVTYKGELLHLTPKEYGLLELFLRHPRRIFSRSAILDHIWSSDEFPGEEAVTTQIKGLRQKLKAAGIKLNLIETVYGLGYRLKNAPTPEPEDKKAKDGVSEAKIRAAVAQIWQTFKASLPEKIDVFRQVSVTLATGTLNQQLCENAKLEAHRLVGSLGSFGCAEGSKIAREIEQLLQTPTQATPQDAHKLKHLIDSLQQAIATKSTLNQVTPPACDPPSASTSPARLLVIDDDQILSQHIEIEAKAWGLQVDSAPHLQAAKRAIALHPPNVILLDLTFADTQENGFKLLEELAVQHSDIPVLIFSSQNHLSSRVKAARLGATTFLQKPMTPPAILQAVTQAINQPKSGKAKVLVVDDDPQILALLRHVLQPWGLNVTTLAHPQRFWDVLEAVSPDLLILDVEMPEYSGIELCQVVRHDLRWSKLPVLFLSAHTEVQTVQQVFTVGADDYIKKPIVEAELITRVLNRLERRSSNSSYDE